MVLLGDVGHVESRFGLLGGQCWCKIGAMELQGDVGNVESLFGSFGDSVGVGAR